MKNSHTSREMRWKPAEWSYQQCGSGGESNLMRTCEDLMEEVVIRLRCFSLSGGSSCSLMAQGISQGFPGSPAFPHWPPCMHTHTHMHEHTHAHPAGPSLPLPLSGARSPVPSVPLAVESLCVLLAKTVAPNQSHNP